MSRDPKANPRPGDVLCKEGRTRRVVNVVGLNIYWSRGKPGSKVQCAWISTWREWARTADVVEVAP